MSKKTPVENAASMNPDDLPALPSEWSKPPDMPWFIPNDEEQGVYRFILASAKRARQLQAGARPLISSTSRKPTKIAMEEIRSGSVEVDVKPEGSRRGPKASYAALDLPSSEAPSAPRPKPPADTL